MLFLGKQRSFISLLADELTIFLASDNHGLSDASQNGHICTGRTVSHGTPLSSALMATIDEITKAIAEAPPTLKKPKATSTVTSYPAYVFLHKISTAPPPEYAGSLFITPNDPGFYRSASISKWQFTQLTTQNDIPILRTAKSGGALGADIWQDDLLLNGCIILIKSDIELERVVKSAGLYDTGEKVVEMEMVRGQAKIRSEGEGGQHQGRGDERVEDAWVFVVDEETADEIEEKAGQ